MNEELIHTDVDLLMDILKNKKKIELKEVAKQLRVPEDAVQRWVDFLVEENILSVEYDFTKPIISLVEQEKRKKKDARDKLTDYKKKFRRKSVDEESSEFMWKQHLLENLEYMKQFFYTEADKREFKKIDNLWEEYKERVAKL